MGDEMHGLGPDSGNAAAKRMMNSRRLIWGLGQRLVNGAAKKVADDFFANFANAVKPNAE